MKLNYRRTVLIGFAFFSICAFWQMYNSVIPLMLSNTFHMNETLTGVIMAADNVLALFLLPFFGALSDRCDTRWGRRMPFIVVGTALAVVFMLLLPAIDDAYSATHSQWLLFAFIGVLLVVLFSMGVYRSPAVALMPDLTPKPLRSAGNAVINLMGAVGGIIYLGLAAVLYKGAPKDGSVHVDYLPLFAVVAGIMVISVLIVAISIDEKRLAAEAERVDDELASADSGVQEPAGPDAGKAHDLSPEVRRSLAFLLASIALWFIGYNAIDTWFTKYASAEWGMNISDASSCLMVCSIGAILSYLPSGFVSGKIGRKKTILAGVLLLGGGFLFCALWTAAGQGFSPVLYAVMVDLGCGWAFINVNSLPMVVEMCKDSDVGKFTGLYYTFSMAAQTVTPILAGWLMRHIDYGVLFVYSTVFVFASFATMQFVRHGDARPVPAAGLEAFEELDA